MILQKTNIKTLFPEGNHLTLRNDTIQVEVFPVFSQR